MKTENKYKHTPGPWKLTIDEPDTDMTPLQHATIHSGPAFGPNGFEVTAWLKPADAHLIAAAPF
jgi:hypothetical protein